MSKREKTLDVDALARELLASAIQPRDQLPYTSEFKAMKASFNTKSGQKLSDNEFWRLLTRVGKKGGLKTGARKRASTSGPVLTADQQLELLRLFPDGIGGRDGLPYTKVFEDLHFRFRQLTQLNLSQHDFWRAVSNVAKQSRKPKPLAGPLPIGELPHELVRSLEDQNPWWFGKPAKRTEPYRRWAYHELVRKVDSGLTSIVAIRGTRQVGKSELQRQLVEELLLMRQVTPAHILRVQFDEVPTLGRFESPILAIVRWFEEAVLGESINTVARSGEPIYLLFDELQNLAGWENQLKELVDHRSVHVIATGSSALRIAQGQDSLAGRISMIDLGPLRLREIAAIRFKETLPPVAESGLEQWTTPEFWRGLLQYAEEHHELLRRSFQALADFGGYPICHKLQSSALFDRSDLRDQIQGLVVDRTILHDLKAGARGRARNAGTVKAVFRQICRYAGQSITAKSIHAELSQLGYDRISRDTIDDAIAFLVDSLLVAEIPPFEGLGKKAAYPAKLCLADHFVREAWLQEQVPLDPTTLATVTEAVATQSGHLAESLVGAYFSTVPGLEISWFPATSSEEEIDFILTIGLKQIPVEVKYRRSIKAEDAAAVRSFVSQPKYNAPFGIVITQEKSGEEDGVFFVPMHALMGLR